ncbi:PAS domain-containing protein, partial [Mariprofundus micogutta]|uniref:PAS domain-containing protein n=1 Tax=Mariprofundus micogutta TaxID=1921010 RepID=UPI00116034E8
MAKNSNYREAFESSNDAIVCSDESGLIQLWNPAAEKMFGYEAVEAVGQPLTILMSTANQKKHQIGFSHFLLTGEPRTLGEIVEVNAQKKDGTILPIELSLSSRKRADGWHFTAIMRDISERNHLDDILKESESRFRSISESLPMGMHVYQLDADEKLVFIDSNPAADLMLGVDNSQLIGREIEQAFPSVVKSGMSQRFIEAARDGIAWQTEQLDYEDEKIIGAFEIYAFQISPGRMAAIFSNITERKQIEADLHRSESHLTTLTEAMVDAMFSVNMPERRITYANQAMRQLFGYSLEEVIGETTEMFYPDEAAFLAFGQKIQHSLARGESHIQSEEMLLAKNGNLFCAEVSTSFIYSDGVLSDVISIVRDISERKQAEGRVRESERMLKEAQRIGHMGNWEFDLIRDSAVFSDESYRIFGVSKDIIDGTFKSF